MLLQQKRTSLLLSLLTVDSVFGGFVVSVHAASGERKNRERRAKMTQDSLVIGVLGGGRGGVGGLSAYGTAVHFRRNSSGARDASRLLLVCMIRQQARNTSRIRKVRLEMPHQHPPLSSCLRRK